MQRSRKSKLAAYYNAVSNLPSQTTEIQAYKLSCLNCERGMNKQPRLTMTDKITTSRVLATQAASLAQLSMQVRIVTKSPKLTPIAQGHLDLMQSTNPKIHQRLSQQKPDVFLEQFRSGHHTEPQNMSVIQMNLCT